MFYCVSQQIEYSRRTNSKIIELSHNNVNYIYTPYWGKNRRRRFVPHLFADGIDERKSWRETKLLKVNGLDSKGIQLAKRKQLK